MTEEERHIIDQTIPALLLQGIGLSCLLVSVLVIYDAWYVVGALGITLTFGRSDELSEIIGMLRTVLRRRRDIERG